MGNDIRSMTIDQASRRAQLATHQCPTYNPSEKDDKIDSKLVRNGMDAEVAYSWTELYARDQYMEFIQNPLEKDRQTNVKNEVLSFLDQPGEYHMLIKDAKEEMEDIDTKREGSTRLVPPLLPSFLINGK